MKARSKKHWIVSMEQRIGRLAPGGGMLYPHNGLWPDIADDCFIAPGARIIGDVKLGAGSSIWFNCVLRGDVGKIVIGRNTNIQDGSVVHVDSGGFDTTIGDNVLIGHMAMIHGTTIKNGGCVGLDATTMDGCVINEQGMLAAGSLLSPNKTIGSRQLWMGRPAKFTRDLDSETINSFAKFTQKYANLAQNYLAKYSS